MVDALFSSVITLGHRINVAALCGKDKVSRSALLDFDSRQLTSQLQRQTIHYTEAETLPIDEIKSLRQAMPIIFHGQCQMIGILLFEDDMNVSFFALGKGMLRLSS